MPHVEIHGTSLDYAEHGSGDPVVLVHGSVSDRRTWENQFETLGRHYRVIAYSRRYHWPNQPIPGGADYRMEEHVDDLGAVIRSLANAPVHLIGHSYGAFLCLLLAIREPQLVRTLVLEEPPAITLFVSSSPKPGEILSLMFRRPRTATAILTFGARGIGPAASAISKGNREKCVRHLGYATLGRDAFHRLSDSRLQQVRENLIDRELLGSGFAPLEDEQVRSVQNPTLLLTAERSPRLFHHLADRLSELLPNVETATIPDASHIMQEDNPNAYNSAVLSFLERQG
jgi:pimeloyl-ACP methyl ester carboxylesterase